GMPRRVLKNVGRVNPRRSNKVIWKIVAFRPGRLSSTGPPARFALAKRCADDTLNNPAMTSGANVILADILAENKLEIGSGIPPQTRRGADPHPRRPPPAPCPGQPPRTTRGATRPYAGSINFAGSPPPSAFATATRASGNGASTCNS